MKKNTKIKRKLSILNKGLRIFFTDALRVALFKPAQALFFYRTIVWQKRAMKIRSLWKQKKINVPPIIIFSITGKCNLQCKDCYAQNLRPSTDNELTEEEIKDILKEAQILGISFFVIAGGEPFMRKEFLRITKEFPEILFLVFSNGLLINKQVLRELKRQKNIIPLISLEGGEEDTDKRRGVGVHDSILRIIKMLKRNNVFFGTSITITRETFGALTEHTFIQNLINSGCKFFLFIEYTPTTAGTEDLVITDEQRVKLMNLMELYHSRRKALFVAVPGKEEEVGGCLASGRGFVHISAQGDVEPCPFAPFSDVNIRDVSLKEALQSDLLRIIREHHGELSVTEGGCALWKKREWVNSLLEKKGEK